MFHWIQSRCCQPQNPYFFYPDTEKLLTICDNGFFLLAIQGSLLGAELFFLS